MRNLLETIKFNLITRPVIIIYSFKYAFKWVKIGKEKDMTLSRIKRLAYIDCGHSLYLLMKDPTWSWLF